MSLINYLPNLFTPRGKLHCLSLTKNRNQWVWTFVHPKTKLKRTMVFDKFKLRYQIHDLSFMICLAHGIDEDSDIPALVREELLKIAKDKTARKV